MGGSERNARRRRVTSQVMMSLTGGALAVSLLMIVGLLTLITWKGFQHFWPPDLWELELSSGERVLGEIHERAEESVYGAAAVRMKVGNRDLTGVDFRWVPEGDVTRRSRPNDAVLLERQEWGNFYGFLVEVRRGEEVLATDRESAWRVFHELHPAKRAELARVHGFERGEIGDLNHELEELRLDERRLALSDLPAGERSQRQARIDAEVAEQEALYAQLADELVEMRRALDVETVVLEAVSGRRTDLPMAAIVRAVRPNELGIFGSMGLLGSRVWEFLWDEPRESNTEGGVFPAIFGTVMMVFIMSIAVVPFGVTAAVYLREYAKEGTLVRLIRIAVNNLAGVPSIVFGVFGLGFFVYLMGGSLDALFYPERLPRPTFGTGGILWASLTLALLTVPVVIVATEEGLASVPRALREGSRAVGATRFETLWRVTLPAAAPGVLTGVILAMARAAGEVAPLMIVGMVKLAPALPVDHHFPFVHLERKFMHLGFHIFDVGFQSPNVEAAKPLAYATTLLIVLLVLAMTLTAIIGRERLRMRYRGQAV